MSEEVKKQEQDEAVIKAIKEEYEKKLEEQRVHFEEEKKKALDEAEEKHVKQIRALLSGERHVDEKPEEREPETREDALLEDLKNRFHL